MTRGNGSQEREEPALRRSADILQLLQDSLPMRRRVVRRGEMVYQVSQPSENLYVVSAGFFKMVTLSSDGRAQGVGLQVRGDWLGLDGVGTSHYRCDSVALDTGEIWVFRYDALMGTAAREPALLSAMHEAMSQQIVRNHAWMSMLCSLPADARVAEFLGHWVHALSSSGLRTDQIRLCMTRREIGNFLGLTLESVSRALSRLAKQKIIGFATRSGRDIHVFEPDALTSYAQCTPPRNTQRLDHGMRRLRTHKLAQQFPTDRRGLDQRSSEVRYQ